MLLDPGRTGSIYRVQGKVRAMARAGRRIVLRRHAYGAGARAAGTGQAPDYRRGGNAQSAGRSVAEFFRDPARDGLIDKPRVSQAAGSNRRQPKSPDVEIAVARASLW